MYSVSYVSVAIQGFFVAMYVGGECGAFEATVGRGRVSSAPGIDDVVVAVSHGYSMSFVVVIVPVITVVVVGIDVDVFAAAGAVSIVVAILVVIILIIVVATTIPTVIIFTESLLRAEHQLLLQLLDRHQLLLHALFHLL